jgi:hypothetical protein
MLINGIYKIRALLFVYSFFLRKEKATNFFKITIICFLNVYNYLSLFGLSERKWINLT